MVSEVEIWDSEVQVEEGVAACLASTHSPRPDVNHQTTFLSWGQISIDRTSYSSAGTIHPVSH